MALLSPRFVPVQRTTGMLRKLLASISLAVLAACTATPKFNAIDITGTDYAREFSLRDPYGKARTLAEFHGKVVLLFFGFTQCPDVCPTALTRAAEVKKQLGSDSDKLQVIFVTVDPERDSAVVLKAYTGAFDPTFLGLSTDVANTEATADAFHIFFRKVPTGASYTMDHTAITYVYDPRGDLRLAVKHDLTAEQLTADVRALLAQRTQSN